MKSAEFLTKPFKSITINSFWTLVEFMINYDTINFQDEIYDKKIYFFDVRNDEIFLAKDLE